MVGPIRFDTEDVSDIPLPNELPAPISREELLRRQAPMTFESLIDQNEDLMSRLSVSLRKCLELENHISQLIERNKYLELQAKTLHTEMKVIGEENKKYQSEFHSLRQQRDSAESTFAELQSSSAIQLKKLFAQTSRFLRYQKRIQKYVRPQLDLLNAKLQSEAQVHSKSLAENLDLKERLQKFKEQLSAAYERIQKQHTEHESDKRRLVEAYEGKLSGYLHDLQNIKTDFENMARKYSQLQNQNQDALEKVALFENRAILSERRLSETKSQHEALVIDSTAQIQSLKDQIQKLFLEKSEAESQAALFKQRLSTMEQEHVSLQDRYNGLQMVWEDLSNSFAESQDQNVSLQKLNQELAKSLSDKRRENELLSDKYAQLEERSSQKIKSLFENVKGLPRIENGIEENKHGPMVKKLESLLAEFDLKP